MAVVINLALVALIARVTPLDFPKRRSAFALSDDAQKRAELRHSCNKSTITAADAFDRGGFV